MPQVIAFVGNHTMDLRVGLNSRNARLRTNDDIKSENESAMRHYVLFGNVHRGSAARSRRGRLYCEGTRSGSNGGGSLVEGPLSTLVYAAI
jgi:hypothetical protein